MLPKLPSRRHFLTSATGLCVATGVHSTGTRLRANAPIEQQLATTADHAKVATGQRGVVATVNPIASQAAIQAFDRGGNAIDAAIAASLMLSVVDGFNSGLGGGCLILVRTAKGTLHAIDGREKAPGRARPEMFFRDGKPDPQLSQIGPLAAGVPGLLAALDRIGGAYGKLAMGDALEGAAQVAARGFKIDRNYASRLRSAAGRLKRFPESARILLDAKGEPWRRGDTLVQADLGRTLERIAKEGIYWFYEGEFAERASRFLQAEGGVMEAADFAAYNTVAREPILCDYRGKQVVGFPPPSSGGIHIAQMLGMLSTFPVQELFEESEATGRHLLLEVMKRAMSDRAFWLGDADFAKVPRGLLDADYLAQRAASIDLERATVVESHGQPPRADVDLFGRGGHTTHLSTADHEGNVVAITQTVNTTFGCKMIVPGTGVVLNNELDDFSIAPGVRNAFGLLGSEANLIAPGKRPLSSMSPTIVLGEHGAPRLACGAAGGPKIITSVLQILVRALDLGQSIDSAIAAPRAHHQWSPDQAVCENAISDNVVSDLKSRGHEVTRIASAAVAQGLSIASQNGTLTAAADPRVPSSAQAL